MDQFITKGKRKLGSNLQNDRNFNKGKKYKIVKIFYLV